MNTKKAIAPLLLLTVLLGLFSCGGGGPYETACNAAATKLFKACDQHNDADVTQIHSALQGMGVAISAAEIASASEGEVSAKCQTGLAELKADITEEDAKTFADSLTNLTTCDDVVTTILDAVHSL